MNDDLPPQMGSGSHAPHTAWYADAMAHLVVILQNLSQVHDVPAIARIVSDAGRDLVGSDGATFVLREGDHAFVVEQIGSEQIWKGRRFPLDSSITGRAILGREPVVIEDVRTHPLVPPSVAATGVLQSLAVVPIRKTAPVGAICIYWNHRHVASEEELAVLQSLADITSVAWENVRLLNELQDKIRGLEIQAGQIREQHETLGVFTHALAHDLKEPVRTIRGFVDLIDASEPGENTTAYFDFIRRAADRMAMLVDTVFRYSQLHDPSRFTKGTCAMSIALDAARDNLSQLITEYGASVTEGPLPTVEANSGQMMQILQNLIANAIRHCDGPVQIHISAEDLGDQWVFSVRDTGPGVEQEDLERIFLPFKRLSLSEEGAGLGLAICTRIIALHGGRLWCESTPGEGADFRFTLPKAAQEADAPAALPRSDSGLKAAKGLARVLLVDDREADIELTRVLLFERDKAEFDLSVARSGREALHMVRQACENGAGFDLVLLDINMPGMDGFETLQALRKESHETAVVMCTGSTYDVDVEKARQLGAAGYMVKPASLAQLKSMVDEMPGLNWQNDGASSRLFPVT